MEKYNLAFKYRIYLNDIQEELILKTFGCTRLVYNKFLAQRKELYETEKKSVTYNTQMKELPVLKNELEFLKEIDSISLQITLKNLEIAYKNFFQKRTSFPKFKSKKSTRKSYSTNNVNNSIRLVDKYIKLPKLGLVKIKLHRNMPLSHIIKSVTISQEPNGAFYVSILKFFRKYQDKLTKLQRELFRKVKFSQNWYKAKLKVAKLHQIIKIVEKIFYINYHINL
ncbi:transposase [uncultured Cetobacterium sp.]|uniref:transposase n=2 Tax=uncultured Cetobacterium sp. TaxID=527638 RepID=UPI0026270766|nr:transposase [uncultured Cetobacterium sp.]